MDMFRAPAPLDVDLKFFGVSVTATIIFFWIQYFIVEAYMDKKKNLVDYQNLPKGQKADYISRIIANIHAVISSVFAVMGLVWSW
jgi:hypothetical protein